MPKALKVEFDKIWKKKIGKCRNISISFSVKQSKWTETDPAGITIWSSFLWWSCWTSFIWKRNNTDKKENYSHPFWFWFLSISWESFQPSFLAAYLSEEQIQNVSEHNQSGKTGGWRGRGRIKHSTYILHLFSWRERRSLSTWNSKAATVSTVSLILALHPSVRLSVNLRMF